MFSQEAQELMEKQLQENVGMIEELRKENKINQEEYEQRIKEANTASQEAMKSLNDEISSLRQQVMNAGKRGGLFGAIGSFIDGVLTPLIGAAGAIKRLKF